MPVCQITTNIGDDKMDGEWIEKYSRFLTAKVDRAPEFINIHKVLVKRAFWAGKAPFIQCRIWGTMFNTDNNRAWGKGIIEYLMDNLGLTEDRIVVTFHGIDPSEAGMRNIPIEHPLLGKA